MALAAAPALAAVLALAACGGDDPVDTGSFRCDSVDIDKVGGELTIYSGRNQQLVGPLLNCFADRSGIDVTVQYFGSSDDAALQIDAEGGDTPADVFFSQAPGATGFLQNGGRLLPLPQEILDKVPEEFRSSAGDWVATSARVRTLAYNTETVAPDDLPSSVLEVTDEKWKGKIGVAPSNPSFVDFVSGMTIAFGEDATLEFLEGLVANDAQIFPNNVEILDAVARGEIEVGLVNHYYGAQRLAEDPDAPIANHFFPKGDMGSLVLVANAAILDSGEDHLEQAQAFVDFLLSEAAQRYFELETKEYPVAEGVPADPSLPALDTVGVPGENVNDFGDLLGKTVDLIEESGLADG